jgi:hypothetical protein
MVAAVLSFLSTQQHRVAEAGVLQSDHPERHSLFRHVPYHHVYRSFFWCWNVSDVYEHYDDPALSLRLFCMPKPQPSASARSCS